MTILLSWLLAGLLSAGVWFKYSTARDFGMYKEDFVLLGLIVFLGWISFLGTLGLLIFISIARRLD